MAKALLKEFEFGHDLCFVLHDFLAKHIVAGELAELSSFNVPLRTREESKALRGLEGDACWDWLKKNGYQSVLDEFTRRQLIFGLLADMCHFIYEGLKCSEKGKLSVALANFRKPFQDNLFYLEWILTDWPDFLSRYKQGPEYVDLSKLSREAKKSRRIQIIEKAVEQTIAGKWIEALWLYEVRYEKDSDFGLDPLFNQALHLITTFKHYATSIEDINFIFHEEDDRESLWRHLYLTLPLILFHSLFVVRSLFTSLKKSFEVHDTISEIWLIAGLLIWSESVSQGDDRIAASVSLREMFTELQVDCPNCGFRLQFEADSILRFWDCGEASCDKCKSVFELLTPSHVYNVDSDE